MFTRKRTYSESPSGRLGDPQTTIEAPQPFTVQHANPQPANSAATTSPPNAIRSEGAVLIGRGTRITGEINDCDLMEIQGVFEGNAVANSVVVREGGGFNGKLQTNNAEVHGVVEGTIVVRELLDIGSTGKVKAELTYGRLSVAPGGHIAGSIQTQPAAEAVDQPRPQHDETFSMNGSAPH